MASDGKIERRAADYLAQRDSGRWTDRDETELAAWLASSTAHMVEFLRLEAAWEAADRYRALGAGVGRGPIPTLRDWQHSPFFRHAPRELGEPLDAPGERASVRDTRWVRLAFAATVLVGIGIAAFLYVHRNVYSTAVGVTTAIPLSDGSKITLNTRSTIRTAMSDTQRMIILEEGEAYFEVAKDEKRPFVVNVGKRQVTALGTAFSVRKMSADDVRVLVTEGSVAVVDPQAPDKRTVLTVGSAALAARAKFEVHQRPIPQLQEALSWRAGYLVFHHTPLAEVVAEFNRYNERQIVIRDPALATIPVSGNFRANNLEAFARLLRSGLRIDVQEEGGRLSLGGR